MGFGDRIGEINAKIKVLMREGEIQTEEMSDMVELFRKLEMKFNEKYEWREKVDLIPTLKATAEKAEREATNLRKLARRNA